MADLFDRSAVPLHEQIAAAERELEMRRIVYPRRIFMRKMTQALADREIAAMAAIVATLRAIHDGRGVPGEGEV